MDEEVVAFAEHPLAVAAHEGVLGTGLPALTQHLGLAVFPVPFWHLDGVFFLPDFLLAHGLRGGWRGVAVER